MKSHASVQARDAMPGIGRRRSHMKLAALCALGAVLLLLNVVASAQASAPVFQSSFDGSTGASRTLDGSMSPSRLAVDESTGNVYVIDTAHDAVDVFDSSGAYLSQIRGDSTTAGSFSFGSGEDDIAVDSNGGNVYVASNGGLVFAFRSDGTFLWQGGSGFVCGIGVDTAGNPWYSDAFNGVQQLSAADGSAVGPLILGGSLICHLDFDGQNRLVGNYFSGGIEKFDTAGNSVQQYSPGDTSFDVAVDRSNGDAYDLSNGGSGGSRAWDRDGNLLYGGGTFGPTDAIGLAIDSVHRKVYFSRSSTVEIYRIIDQHAVTVTETGTGTGRVISSPTGIDCPDTACSARFDDGSPVELTATPDSGSELIGWTGCDSVSLDGTRCTVTPNGADVNVSAQFDLVPRHLSVTVNGPGTVTSTPAGISCPSDCDEDFPADNLIALRATPAAGATFAGWSGDCSGVNPNCQITMSGDRTATATFTQNPPTVSNPVGTPTSTTTATVRADVNPNNDPTTCEFEYGPTTSYGTRAPCASDPGSGTSAVGVSADLTGLTPGATYHFRIDATNGGGTTRGADATFTVPFPAPAATTGAASGITQTGARLGGSVNPNGASTTCTFQYGTTTAYGSSVPCASAPGSGSSAVAVSAAVSGLTAGTTYHYRVVATNSGGTTNGGDQTFTTASPPPPPPSNAEPTLPATASVSGTVALLAIGCRGDAGATCRGTVKLTAKVKVKGGRGKRAKARTIVVGTGTYDLAVGRTQKVKVHLSKAARALLKKASLRATATAGDVTRTLTVKKPKARRKHRK